jgi:hypothetical protein
MVAVVVAVTEMTCQIASTFQVNWQNLDFSVDFTVIRKRQSVSFCIRSVISLDDSSDALDEDQRNRSRTGIGPEIEVLSTGSWERSEGLATISRRVSRFSFSCATVR